MENQTIMIPELEQLLRRLGQAIAVEIRGAQSAIPRYLKFPEDIITITGGYIAESTVRSWKTQGYLKTVKIGTKTYIKPEDWDWFLDNHRVLMQKSERNRKNRLGTKNDNKK